MAADSTDKVPSAITTFNTPRFILHIGNPAVKDPTGYFPSSLIAEYALEIMQRTEKELVRIFKQNPEKKVVLRLLSPDDFKRYTGAPSWTSAMYFRDEITIPLSHTIVTDPDELERALRHEHTHALVAEFSSYRCPAWIDEGVAQLLEGEVNPILAPALRKWIGENSAMPLEWLQDGFTGLGQEIVPAAYAQSLFATRTLVHEKGFSAVVSYLNLLKSGEQENTAFATAFGKSKAAFESQLTGQIRRWAASDVVAP